MRRWVYRALLILIAVILGELVLVLGTTFAQEILVDGVHWETSGTSDLVLGGTATVLAAILSGIVAYATVRKRSAIPLVILSILVIAETTWLIVTGRTTNPLWFSITAGFSLVAGFWAGKVILDRWPNQPNTIK